jgi:hypothetical protein
VSKEIQIYPVPEALSKMARGADYVCRHLSEKLLAGAKLQPEEIGSFGAHDLEPEDGNNCVALCMDCGEVYRIGSLRRQPAPFKEGPMFDNVK